MVKSKSSLCSGESGSLEDFGDLSRVLHVYRGARAMAKGKRTWKTQGGVLVPGPPLWPWTASGPSALELSSSVKGSYNACLPRGRGGLDENVQNTL